MRPALGLPQKILILTLATVLLALGAVGGVFVFLLERHHDRTAQAHVDDSFRWLDRKIQEHTGHALALAATVAGRPDVIARLDLFVAGQGRGDPDPAVVEEEKKKLALVLEQVAAIGLAHRITVHDAEGHPVAFHTDDRNGAESSGYVVTRQDGEPEPRFTDPETRPKPATRTMALAAPGLSTSKPMGGVLIRQGELVAAGESPVSRVGADGREERLGAVFFMSVLDQAFVDEVARAAGHGFALALPDGRVLASEGMAEAALRLRSVPFGEQEKAGFPRSESTLLGIRPIMTADHGQMLAAFQASRGEILAQMSAFRGSVFWAFVGIVLVVLPAVHLLVGRLVSRPVGELLRGVAALKAGQAKALVGFRSRDELGLLAGAFNDMADAVRDREEGLRRAHDNLEVMVEERTRALTAEIEERRRAERALVESQERLRLIFEGAADAIVSIDSKGIIEAVNPAAEAMFGYPIREMLGRNVSMLMPEPHRGRHDGYLEAYLRTGEAKVIGRRTEVMARRRDGGLFPIELSVSAALREGGPLFTGIIADITGRLEAEERIGKLSRAVEASPVSVVITDPEGVIEYVNPAFSEISGYSFAEIVGRTPAALKSGRTPDAVYEAMWRTISAGRVWHGEFSNRRKDGVEYWVSASISPVTGVDGSVTHFVAVEEDITERKALEAALREARDQAESANRAKSEFLSSMSHELRTPMNAILGFSQLLLHNPREPLSASQTEYVGHVLTAGNHLLELINEVLDLARVEAGRLVLSMEDLEIAPHLEECLLLTRAMAEGRGIAVIDATRGATLPRLRADATRFRQVLLNLLSNAVKYNVEGGGVTLAAQPMKGRLRLSVADTGPGIPPARQDQLFKPFNRLGAEGGTVEGTGIGLTITRKLVEQMGGQIGFTSESGFGSTFWFELPVAEDIQPQDK